jgi:hypothetical protein
MLCVVIDRVVRSHHSPTHAQRLTGVWIHIEAGEIAARNVDANAVPLFENVAGWEWLDPEAINLTGFQ